VDHHFLTDGQQLVRLGKNSHQTPAPSELASPRGLFSLYTNNCTAKYPSVKLLKLADDTILTGLIQDDVWWSHYKLKLMNSNSSHSGSWALPSLRT